MAVTHAGHSVLPRCWRALSLLFIFLKDGNIGVSHALINSSPLRSRSARPVKNIACRRSQPSFPQRSTHVPTSDSPTALGSFLDTLLSSKDSAVSEAACADDAIPFVIQRIGRGTESEIKELTRMCIDVFFNKQDNVDLDEKTKRVTPWKAVQLAYLRNYQYGDIMARKSFKKEYKIDFIVARRVYPASDAANSSGSNTYSVEDESQIVNMENLSGSTSGNAEGFVAGEIIGFGEVAEKPFGLGVRSKPKKGEATIKGPKDDLRPYLSNLSVVESARKSGVGSCLLDACEQAVLDWDAGYKEIVLQVEEDNESAVEFYKKRGWELVFADPTCRRYDTSGLFLKESRITKYAMIKPLSPPAEDSSAKNGDATGIDFGKFFFAKIRESIEA